MIRDYFGDLELDPSAGPDEIRRAYKILARRFHPDLNPSDPLSSESFRRIQEAFDFLNSESRIVRLRKDLRKAGERPRDSFIKWGQQNARPSTIQELSQEWNHVRAGESLDIDLHSSLSFSEIKMGTTRNLSFFYECSCSECRGAGAKSGAVRATCKKCAGLGYMSLQRGAYHWKKTCDSCAGLGYVTTTPCRICAGKGRTTERETLEVQLRPPIDLSEPIRLANFGHYSWDGKQRGNVWLHLKIQKR